MAETVKLGTLSIGDFYRRPRGRVSHILVDPKDVEKCLVGRHSLPYVDLSGHLHEEGTSGCVAILDQSTVRYLRTRRHLQNIKKRLWVVALSTGRLEIASPNADVIASKTIKRPSLWEVLLGEDFEVGEGSLSKEPSR